jgi:hypothetical protein
MIEVTEFQPNPAAPSVFVSRIGGYRIAHGFLNPARFFARLGGGSVSSIMAAWAPPAGPTGSPR